MKLLVKLLLISFCLSLPFCFASNNITKILQSHPEYSTFSSLCSKYGVASQIDSRNSITVLVPSNSVLDPIVQSSTFSAQTVFNILSFHILLDYFDLAKLKQIANGTVLSTTLYQTTGLAAGNEGFVNITDESGVIHVGKPDKGAPLTAIVDKEIYTDPFNISVLDISQVLVPAGVVGAPAPSPSPTNITQLIAQAKQYTTFLSLLKATGVDVMLQSHDTPPGVTIFCPDDGAFAKLPKNLNLSSAEQVALLEFHAIGSFYSVQQLGTLSGAQNTLASGSGGGSFQYVGISQNKSGSVVIDTGKNSVPLGPTLYSQEPLGIYGISSVLLPSDIFGLAPKSAPTPSPVASPTPAAASSPTPTPSASSPSPTTAPSSSLSPPAPPATSPASSSPSSGPSPASSKPSSAPHTHIALTLASGLPLIAFSLFA